MAQAVAVQQALEQSVQEKFKKYLANAGLDCKDYQVKGVEWCVEHETNGYKIQEDIYSL